MDGKLDESLDEIEELIEQANRAARSISFELSPPVLHDLGLEPAVQWLVENIQARYGIEIVLEDDGQPKPADEKTRVILFRSIRELLINAAKHAGARRVHVRLEREKDLRERRGRGRRSRHGAGRRGRQGIRPVQHPRAPEPRRREHAHRIGARARDEDPPVRAAHERETDESEGGGMSVRVLLVDDHQMMREGLRALLAGVPDIEVVGEASDGRTALDLVRTLSPDVVVMDVGMPELNGVEATRQIRAEHERVKVIALSTHTDKRYVHHMLEAGACGYVLKIAAHDELLRAVRAASVGKTYLSPEIAGLVVERSTQRACRRRSVRLLDPGRAGARGPAARGRRQDVGRDGQARCTSRSRPSRPTGGTSPRSSGCTAPPS